VAFNEFGVKVSLAMTLKGNLIVVARNFAGNPNNGHTMREQIEHSAILMQSLGSQSLCTYTCATGVWTMTACTSRSNTPRGKDKRRTDEKRILLKRRKAIEPIIAHLKADHRMDPSHLKGS
jgi:IS5 family transposase